MSPLAWRRLPAQEQPADSSSATPYAAAHTMTGTAGHGGCRAKTRFPSPRNRAAIATVPRRPSDKWVKLTVVAAMIELMMSPINIKETVVCDKWRSFSYCGFLV